MPPRRTRQPPPHNLSWFSAPQRWATLTPPSSRNRCRLEKFCHHIRAHDIPYFHASYQVFVLGPHSRQYFRTSLRSLLTLDYIPRKVKLPVHTLPHNCRFCPEVTRHIFQHRHPFEYIVATPHSRGQPRQDTIPPASSTKESNSEPDSDNSEPPIDNDSTTTGTSTHNGSPSPPPASPPIPESCPSNTRSTTATGGRYAQKTTSAHYTTNAYLNSPPETAT